MKWLQHIHVHIHHIPLDRFAALSLLGKILPAKYLYVKGLLGPKHVTECMRWPVFFLALNNPALSMLEMGQDGSMIPPLQFKLDHAPPPCCVIFLLGKKLPLVFIRNILKRRGNIPLGTCASALGGARTRQKPQITCVLLKQRSMKVLLASWQICPYPHLTQKLVALPLQ